jgi:hypothetical protein
MEVCIGERRKGLISLVLFLLIFLLGEREKKRGVHRLFAYSVFDF